MGQINKYPSESIEFVLNFEDKAFSFIICHSSYMVDFFYTGDYDEEKDIDPRNVRLGGFLPLRKIFRKLDLHEFCRNIQESTKIDFSILQY